MGPILRESTEEATSAALRADAGTSSLTLTLLGAVRLVSGSDELRLRNRKARAVLACLALADNQELTRERIAGLLWSESSEEKARASLRQVVHELREVLPDGALVAERLTLCLAPGVLRHDVEAVLAALAVGVVPPRLLDTAGLAERFLDGFDDLDPAFGSWLRAQRQSLQERLLAGLERLLDDGQSARSAARALLNLDPTHEAACRRVMLDAARDGDTAGALRAYETLWNLLGEDYDMEPSAPTQALVAEIKAGRIGPAPAPAEPRVQPPQPPAQPGGARMALFVEPFLEHGVADDRSHLVRGFRHDLIACLVRFREWFVVDGAVPSPAAPGMERASSRYAVSAVAYQSGAAISLVLTIREAGSGVVIWSERSDIDLATWFDAQRDLVRSIATSLRGHVSAARLASLPLQRGVALAAHDRWLLGQSVMRGFRGDRYGRARQLFEEAIAEDPSFSPAYSSLAQSYNGGHIANPGSWRSRATEARSLALARRAVALDQVDSRAQLVLGWALALAGQGDAAAPHMRRAVKLNPYDSWTLISAALYHAFSARHEEAQRLADTALEMALIPSATFWGYQVVVAYLRGDDAATLAACDRAEDVIRTLPAWRAAALWNLGRQDEARAAAGRFFDLVRAAWVGEGAASEAAMGRWLLHQYPFADAANWERLRRGVAGAGIPADGIAFGQWYEG
jgi:DNA-binding SARP family transcriptional activator/TolB-like protein